METKSQTRICVPVCEKDVGAIGQAMASAAADADLIEIRLDCLDPLKVEEAVEKTGELIAGSPRPTILTYRPAEQGGHRDLDTKSRLNFWLFRRRTTPAFYDLELDIAAHAALFDHGKPLDWSRVICSHHDFQGLPPNLSQIYERMTQTPARILKIAVQANDITDCLGLFSLLDKARADGREMIAIAMGMAGFATRVLGPSRGAFLTYGSLQEERATAPGQVTAAELRKLYRIEKISRQTLITGLVGLPVGHSISPHVHNAGFEESGIDGVYLPFEVKDLGSFMRRMVHPRTREIDWNLRGLSVTAPHKNAVISFLDWVDPAAQKIGAVNTIVIDAGQLSGYNTDAGGFDKTLTDHLGELRGARCAVIGAGGGAQAVVYSLRQKQAHVTVFARDVGKGKLLAERFGATCKTIGSERFAGFDVVVNATPLGTSGTQEKRAPAMAEQLAGARLAYDLVYNPRETVFMREARAAGCDVIGGMEMLVAQAAEQFRLWTGVSAPEDAMRSAAINALKQ